LWGKKEELKGLWQNGSSKLQGTFFPWGKKGDRIGAIARGIRRVDLVSLKRKGAVTKRRESITLQAVKKLLRHFHPSIKTNGY